MSVVIGLFVLTGFDFWRLADSIISCKIHYPRDYDPNEGQKKCSHFRVVWAKINEELEVQDCRTSNKYRETTLRGKGNCMLKCLLLHHSMNFL